MLQPEDERVAVPFGIGEYPTGPKHFWSNQATQQKKQSIRIITSFASSLENLKEFTVKRGFNPLYPLSLWRCCRLESVNRGPVPFFFFFFRVWKRPDPVVWDISLWFWWGLAPCCGVSVYHSNCIKSFHYESMWSEFLWHKMGRADNWEWNQCEIVFQLGWSVWSISDRDHSPYQVIILVWSCDCFSSQPDSISACIMQQFLIMSHFSLLQLGWPTPTRLRYFHQQVQDSSWTAPPPLPPFVPTSAAC